MGIFQIHQLFAASLPRFPAVLSLPKDACPVGRAALCSSSHSVGPEAAGSTEADVVFAVLLLGRGCAQTPRGCVGHQGEALQGSGAGSSETPMLCHPQ